MKDIVPIPDGGREQPLSRLVSVQFGANLRFLKLDDLLHGILKGSWPNKEV